MAPNGVLLGTIEDSTFSAGKLGLFAVDAARSQEPDTVQLDNVFVGDPDMVVHKDLFHDTPSFLVTLKTDGYMKRVDNILNCQPVSHETKFLALY